MDIHFFDARHLKNLYDYTISSMQKDGHKPAEIQEQIQGMNAHYHSYRPYLSTYISYIVLGIFFSLVFFLLLRKSNLQKDQSI